MKKYRNPNIPKPSDSKSEATRYKTQPVKPEPTPKPKPKPKRKADKVGNVFIPDFSKPKGNRLRFLNELNEMNKRSR